MRRRRLRVPRAVGLGLSIFTGYFPIAVAFGVVGRSLGFPLPVLAAMSLFVFAGASQFLAVELLATGAGGLGVVVATLLLNARHLVMSGALRDRVEHRGVPRALLAFGVTDEVFAAAATGASTIRDDELLLVEAIAWTGWVAGTVTGSLLGVSAGELLSSALGIALYAMFVGLAVPAILRFARYGVVAAAAGAVNWALTAAGLDRGIALLAAIVLAAGLFACVPGWSEADG